MKKRILIVILVCVVFACSYGNKSIVAHLPNPDDLKEIEALGRIMDNEFDFVQDVCIAFTTQENPKNRTNLIYHASYYIPYIPTAGLHVVLQGPKESRFDDVADRIRSIINAQGMEILETRRNEGTFFKEEVIFLKYDFGGLQERDWIKLCMRIFAEHPKFFYHIQIERVKA